MGVTGGVYAAARLGDFGSLVGAPPKDNKVLVAALMRGLACLRRKLDLAGAATAFRHSSLTNLFAGNDACQARLQSGQGGHCFLVGR